MAALNLATGREGGAVPKTIAVLGSALFFAVAPARWRGSFHGGLRIGSFGRPSSISRRARRRDPVDRRRSTRACRLVCTLLRCKDWARRRRSHRRRTSVVTGLYRYVRNPIYVALVARHSGPSGLVRRPAPSSVRCVGVARLPRVCRGVRGAGARFIGSERSTRIPGQRPALDSAAHAPGEPHDADHS